MGKTDPLRRFKDHCTELNREALLALRTFEIYRPAANGQRIVAAFHQTYEAWVFNAIRDSLHRDLTMTLGRLWDSGAADDVFSLPKAMNRLRAKDVQRKLRKQAGDTRVRRRASAKIMVSSRGKTDEEIRALEEGTRKFLNSKNPEFRKEAEEKAQRDIDKLLRDYDRVAKRPILLSLRKHRNQRLAHTANPNSPIQATVDNLRWGDEAKILRTTLPLIERLCLLVEECDHNYDDFATVNRFHSRCFWARVCKGPKGSNRRRIAGSLRVKLPTPAVRRTVLA